MDRSDEHSAFAWIMSGAVGVLVAGGIGKALLDKRRASAQREAIEALEREDLGLISPERHGTKRLYRRRDRTRLQLILRGKRLGFPLDQIRTIIDLYDAPRGKRSQLQYVLDQIDDRRTDLEQRRRDLDDALTELDRFEDRCREDLARIT